MDDKGSHTIDQYYYYHSTNYTTNANTNNTYREVESKILRMFNRLGYARLTSIQRKSIPILARRRDSLIVAPTGSGKTEAAMIPILTMVAEAYHDGKDKVKGIKVLYITPLRALNRDMLRRLVRYAEMLGLSVDVRHGDTSSYRKRKMQDTPPDVLITTPETLAIMLVGKMARAFHALEWIVVDELHELLPNKRGAHLALSLERVERLSSRRVVRIGLSATLGNLDTAAKFISYVSNYADIHDDVGRGRGRVNKCAVIVDDSLRKYDVDVVYVDAPIAEVAKHIIEYIKRNRRSSRESILVFTNTRDEAEYIASIMQGINDPTISVDVHHGSLSREVREETESRLRGRDGYNYKSNMYEDEDNNNNTNHDIVEQTNVVVCTSSLELGIDVGSISTVIHYGSPRQVSKMAQRIGRSRHRSTESAKGVIFTNNADDEIEALAILKRLSKGDVEEQRVHESPLDVLAHHLVGLALERYNGIDAGDDNHTSNSRRRKEEGVEVSVEEALALVRQVYQFRNTSIDDVIDCLELLSKNGIVRFDRDRLVFKAAKARAYYYDNASMIPDVLKFDVVDAVSNKVIGSLDQEFVGDYGEQGNIFILKGMQWRILAVDHARMRVNVEPYYAMSMNVPYWSGEMIPVDHKTAQLVGRMRRLVVQGRINDVVSKVLVNAYRELGNTIPDDKRLVIEYSPNLVIIHACLGTRINNTLASLLSTIISSNLGYIVNVRSDPYRIMLSSTARIGKKHITDCFMDDYDLEEIIRVSLKDTHNLNWSIWNVAKRFGLVDTNAMYSKKIARMIYERYANTPIVREALREVLHEKYDIDGTKGIIECLRNGIIKMVWKDVREGAGSNKDGYASFSSLAEPIMERNKVGVGACSNPLSNEQAVIEMVRDRLMKSKHRLVCLKCASSSVVEVSNAPEHIACLKCNSRIVAAIHPYDDDTYNAILLKVRNARLDSEQERRFRRAWKAASLVHTFGKRALLVLSGYGVGVDTAARILRDYAYEQEDVLLKRIYEAERQYITTRGFWDD
ncbi:ATP-dependent RNA helicase DbpA [archaeon HR05]|nr:ATP-dependent RNA helicase DbpA [archaeon HR05]